MLVLACLIAAGRGNLQVRQQAEASEAALESELDALRTSNDAAVAEAADARRVRHILLMHITLPNAWNAKAVTPKLSQRLASVGSISSGICFEPECK